MLQIDRILIKLATGTSLFGGLINEEDLRAFSIAALFALRFDCTLCLTSRVGNRLYYLLAQFTRSKERAPCSAPLDKSIPNQLVPTSLRDLCRPIKSELTMESMVFRNGDRPRVTYVFVCGLPRSGTSLLCRNIAPLESYPAGSSKPSRRNRRAGSMRVPW
jgi:hypothetical protein